MISEDNIIILGDRRKMGYALYGDPKGRPIFFFHGWPSSRLQAKELSQTAEKLHIRVISPDRPGFGLSDYKKDRTLLDFPDDIISLADELKIRKFAIVGVSSGGPYAAVCAYKIPERLTKVGIVVGLAPISAPEVLRGMAFFYKLAWGNYHKLPFLTHLASFLRLALTRKYIPNSFSFMYRTKTDRKLIIGKTKKDMIRNMREAFRQGHKGPALDLKLYTDDWGFNLKDIKTKVFLWYGEVDNNVPLEMGKYYASQIPNSKLTIYPNEGHLVINTHAEEILKTLIQ